MKHTFKVTAYQEIRFTGSLDACIKKAKALNKKEFNASICKIEIWELSETNEWFWVSTLDDFWDYV